MKVEMEPIGRVEAERRETADDDWGEVESCIVLEPRYSPAALDGIEEFSHVEILFLFHRVDPSRIVHDARHPRNNRAWPAVGIFAQRGKNRPNRIGSTICRFLRREGTRLYVGELDALDGTPVLDIKPVMREFLPRSETRQPAWSSELMSRYWRRPG